MPLFNFRLEAQDGSGHFRQGTIEADSREQAKLILEERERDAASFALGSEQEADLLERHGASSLEEFPAAAPVDASEEEKAPFRALPVGDRARLNRHRQDKPYKLKTLEKVS